MSDVLLLLGFLAVVLVGRFLPRLSAYVLGPGLLVLAAALFVVARPWFTFFQSDGSAAGMVIPILMWMLVAGLIVAGLVLITAGRRRIREAEEEGERSVRRMRWIERTVIVFAAVFAVLKLAPAFFGHVSPAELRRAVDCDSGLHGSSAYLYGDRLLMAPCLPEINLGFGKEKKPPAIVTQRYVRQDDEFLGIAPDDRDADAPYQVDLRFYRGSPVYQDTGSAAVFFAAESGVVPSDLVEMSLPPQLAQMAEKATARFRCDGSGFTGMAVRSTDGVAVADAAPACRTLFPIRGMGSLEVVVEVRKGEDMNRALGESLALLEKHVLPAKAAAKLAPRHVEPPAHHLYDPAVLRKACHRTFRQYENGALVKLGHECKENTGFDAHAFYRDNCRGAGDIDEPHAQLKTEAVYECPAGEIGSCTFLEHHYRIYKYPLLVIDPQTGQSSPQKEWRGLCPHSDRRFLEHAAR
ncbi:MAG: hypothetical protein K0S16_1240 [Moraxellaceae bacterium]|jgi:hypothetical protein|nr:hypothetical protein [Moraxellaceae bacterium]